jgi:putative ABC transport system permease protein
MYELLSDFRYGARRLLKSPGFAFVAILALGLGIGANTAIFSLVDRVLIRPLPYADPDRLVTLWEDASFMMFPRNSPTVANFVDWQKQNQVFTDLAASRDRAGSLTGDGPPEMVLGGAVTLNLFNVLGVQPILGRAFTESEDRLGENVIILSYGLWQSRYAADPAVIGRTVLMNDARTTIVGVMPPGFTLPKRKTQFLSPAQFTPQMLNNRKSHLLNVIARLKPGVALERAQSDMAAIARRLEQQYPDTNNRLGAVVVPLKDQIVANTGTALLVLLAAAGCVLLIACANVANLLLAKAVTREREIAIRTALGASRIRLIRQMVTESVLLAVAGGALGLLFGRLSMRVLVALIPSGLPGSSELSIDGRLLLFTLGVSLLTGLAFGLAPAIETTRPQVCDKLKEGGRAGVSGRSSRFRDALVVAEVALAMILLVSAGLLLQTLRNLHAIDAGFNPAGILTLSTRLPSPKYADPLKRVAYFEAVLERVRALPGVASAGFTSNLPFTSQGYTSAFRIEGRPFGPGTNPDALYREVTNDYLQALQARVTEGRLFGTEDRPNSLPVVIINETFKRQYWPGESPLGKRIQTSGDNTPWQTIVGVVADVRERGLELDMKPAVYLPVVQLPFGWNNPHQLAVRTLLSPSAVAKAVREAIWAVDRDQPVADIRTMDEILDLEVANHKQQTQLLGAFASLALILASLGIYGVLSYAVTQRTREIGLRVALGAGAGDVTRLVVARGIALTAIGIAIGAAAALAVTRSMTNLLVGVKAADPAIYATVGALLSIVALAACYFPAARAARVDPIVALREE